MTHKACQTNYNKLHVIFSNSNFMKSTLSPKPIHSHNCTLIFSVLPWILSILIRLLTSTRKLFPGFQVIFWSALTPLFVNQSATRFYFQKTCVTWTLLNLARVSRISSIRFAINQEVWEFPLIHFIMLFKSTSSQRLVTPTSKASLTTLQAALASAKWLV